MCVEDVLCIAGVVLPVTGHCDNGCGSIKEEKKKPTKKTTFTSKEFPRQVGLDCRAVK